MGDRTIVTEKDYQILNYKPTITPIVETTPLDETLSKVAEANSKVASLKESTLKLQEALTPLLADLQGLSQLEQDILELLKTRLEKKQL
jgi:hypothetical protein